MMAQKPRGSSPEADQSQQSKGKVRLGRGDVESWIFDGQTRARNAFLHTAGFLYPGVLEDVRQQRSSDETWPSEAFWARWADKWRLIDHWVARWVWYYIDAERTRRQLAEVF